jgi:predicted amidohydrolase
MVIDPWGTILAQAPDAVAIVHATLDLSRVDTVRRGIPVLANRRPAVY